MRLVGSGVEEEAVDKKEQSVAGSAWTLADQTPKPSATDLSIEAIVGPFLTTTQPRSSAVARTTGVPAAATVTFRRRPRKVAQVGICASVVRVPPCPCAGTRG